MQAAYHYPTNEIHTYKKYDFSDLWLKTANQYVYGIIGSEHRRIRVKLISVVKNQQKPAEYIVNGKSMVQEKVWEIGGIIKIRAIHQRVERKNGEDSTELEDPHLLTAGLIQAEYTFYENRHQPHTGTFSGMLQSKWYMDTEKEIHYDDIQKEADGYFNNSFVGTWQKYDEKKGKLAHWGDYRVPNCNCDFDIGKANISVAPVYKEWGWLDVILADKVTQEIQPTKSMKAAQFWWK